MSAHTCGTQGPCITLELELQTVRSCSYNAEEWTCILCAVSIYWTNSGYASWSLRHMVAQYLSRRGWNSRSTASLHCISESFSLSFFTPFPVRLTSDISHLVLDTTTRGVWGTSSSGHSPPCHSQGVHQILLSSKMLLHTYAHFIFTCYIFILRVCSSGDFIFFFSVSFFSFFFSPIGCVF